MTVRGLIVITLLAIFLVASWDWLTPADDEDPTVDVAPMSYGYYVRNATIYGTDAEGRELYTLRADSMRQDATDESVALLGLEIEYRTDAAPWSLEATEGWMPRDRGRLELRGAVRVMDSVSAESGTMIIMTESLNLDFNAHLAKTGDRVRIEFPTGFLTADGLEADLKSDRLALRNDVRGSFNQ